MKKFFLSVLAVMTLLAFGCATDDSSVTVVQEETGPGVGVIGIAPGGLLAEAIGTELFRKGYQIVPAAQIGTILSRSFPDGTYILDPKVLAKLRQSGIQSILIVTSNTAFGDLPSNAIVQIVSTQDGSTLAATNWHRSPEIWGWERWDWDSRPDVGDAAHEIASSLI
jgi:hypothetical protein